MACSKPMASPFSDDPRDQANPGCVCTTAAQAVLCKTGHLLECHYPQSCESARCSHWQRNQEQTASSTEQ